VLVEPMSVVQKGIDHAFRIQERFAWAPRQAVVLGAGPGGHARRHRVAPARARSHAGSREPQDSARAAYLAEAGIRFRSTASYPLEDWRRALGPIDLVFEATGAARMVFPAVSLLGTNGVCVLSSVTQGETAVDIDASRFNRDMVFGNRVVFGTVNGGRRHFEAAVSALESAEERVPGWIARIITRRLPFTDIRQALERRPTDVKTVLRFD
jgi:threonine dehydrogenase-like Zn-dependent dehydrogenase